jgi:hypothetical protein
MLNYIKEAIIGPDDSILTQEAYVAEAKKYHGGRAYGFVDAYSF